MCSVACARFVAVVKILRKPLGQVAGVVIVDVDQRGDAGPRPGNFERGLLQAGARQIAQCLGAIVVAARAHEAIELRIKRVVDGDGQALHRALLETRWRHFIIETRTQACAPLSMQFY